MLPAALTSWCRLPYRPIVNEATLSPSLSPLSGARSHVLRALGDDRLARMAANGDSAAFAAIYERYLQQLHRYCTMIVGNAEDASDCLQSAMLKAFGALQSSTREITLKPWLYRIAHNESISLLRRRRPAVEVDEENMGASPPAETDLATRERLSHLMADLRELPERQRGAIVLRELNGLEVSEIASWLGTSEGATRQMLFQGRRALHEFSEGRDMDCLEVREALSDNDRRRITNRKVRSHLRECAGCRDYKAVMDARSTDLKAIAPPLPAALAAGLVKSFFGGGASGHALGAGSASGVGATKGFGIAGFGAKAAATVAATVVVGGAAVVVNRVIETQPEGSVTKPPSAPAPRGGSGLPPALSGGDAGATPSTAERDGRGASRRASRRAANASPARRVVIEDSAATAASLAPDSVSSPTGDGGPAPVAAVTLSSPSAPSRPAPSPPSDGTRGKRRLTANPAPRSGSGGGGGSTSCERGGDDGRVEAAHSRRRTAECSPQSDEGGRPRKGRGRDRSENRKQGSERGPKPKTDGNGDGRQGEGRSDEPQGDEGNGNNGNGNGGSGSGGEDNGHGDGNGGGGQIPVVTPTPPVKVAGRSAAAFSVVSPAPPAPAPAPALAPAFAPPPAAPAAPSPTLP